MNHDGVSVTALMVLLAFAVERVTTGVLFLLNWSEGWRRFLSGKPTIAQKVSEQQRYKLAYFILAGILAMLVVLTSPKMLVLSALDTNAPPLLDIGLTWLILVAGADRIGALLPDKSGDAAVAPAKPVQVEGTLTLREERTKSQNAA